MTVACAACGTELPAAAKFCLECGAPVLTTKAAEYKQVTVLFADVVRSMDIAAMVGAERLREIMAELVDRCSAVVQRYSGTVDKFTGDGIMAVFGAPLALEDHALRACRAALDIQQEARALAAELEARDGIDLRLRVGLNSGEVIAGDVGSGALGYTAIGAQVGMAQRMESVAPAGGVMLSESTAQLVQDVVVVGEPESVHIKGASAPVSACRLIDIGAQQKGIGAPASALVGRDWELAALTAMLDRSIKGHGCVAGIVGPAGIGKSRIVAETTALAQNRGIPVFSTFCESHTSEVPFHASNRLLRSSLGADELGEEGVHERIRAIVPDADPADLALLDDELGIRDSAVDLPDISSDARRRRLTALINTLVLARTTPAVFVIEDAHWVDDTSESLLADFLSVVPQTRSFVLITYRPEYHGALSRTPGAQTIALAPLEESASAALVAGMVGRDHSVAALTAQITERAAGNPFFAEEIVRDLAGRGVLTGKRGEFSCSAEAVDVAVPPTLQAAIAARVDRLDAAAKHTLNAAAVIGLRFHDDILTNLVDDPQIAHLIKAELIDQVRFTPRAEYAFRHPLIRAVAYQSQLKADRAELHRRAAAAIQRNDPESADENAVLIGEHLQEAGDLRYAYEWLMRGGTWLTFRDIKAARACWQRARDVADRLPADEPDRSAMRIAPRALLSISAFRAGVRVSDSEFDELRSLAGAADDKVSLALGMAGHTTVLTVNAHYREADELATELITLIESLGEPNLILGVMWAALTAKISVGHVAEVQRVAQRMIDLADGDPVKGNTIVESPLALANVLKATAQACDGLPGWRRALEDSLALSREFAPIGYPVVLLYKYFGLANAWLRADALCLRETAEAYERAERFGDDFTLGCACCVYGLVLAQQDDERRAEGFELLAQAREAALDGRTSLACVPMVDVERAKELVREGNLDTAIALLRNVIDDEYTAGAIFSRAAAAALLVDTLLRRATEADVREAENVTERLAAVPTEPGFVINDIHVLRMRALLARTRGDDAAYRELVDRYREMAEACGYEGHMKLAEGM